MLTIYAIMFTWFEKAMLLHRYFDEQINTAATGMTRSSAVARRPCDCYV